MKQDLHQHVRALRRYALVLCRDAEEAEDLVQETLLRALAAARGYDSGRDLRVWLFSILHNAYVDRLRRARSSRLALAQIDPPAVAAAPQPARVELRETLEALQQLAPEQRAAVVLVGLESVPYAEAAQILGIPVGTLMSRLHRGREALRKLTGEERDRGVPDHRTGRRSRNAG